MKKKINELQRAETKRTLTLNHALRLEDISESVDPAEWREKLSYTPPRVAVCEPVAASAEWAWYRYLATGVFFILTLALVAFSAIIFVAEILNFVQSDSFDLSSYIKPGSGGFTKSQFLCMIPLFYIWMCVYTALFNMKIGGRYGLYNHHHTDAASLIFAALNFSRVSSPMVFNFLQMLKLKGTAFNQVMGSSKLAISFTRYFPLLLILLIFCNIFDVYGRILSKFGLSRFGFNESENNEKVEEGKTLLNKVRNAKIRENTKAQKMKNLNTSDDEATQSAIGSKRSTPKKRSSPEKAYYLSSNDKLREPGNQRSLQDL